MYIYIYKYLRLKEQFFRIACDPSVPSVGTRGAVVRCLDWCDPLPVPRLEPIHLLGIGGLEWSCADLSNNCVSNLRFPLVSVFVALERLLFSLDITLCLIIHVPAGIAALVGQEIEGIQMSWNQNWNEIETIQEKQARSRQARQGGSKVPFYGHAAVLLIILHCLRKRRLYFKLWHQKIRILHHGWTGCCRTRTRRICVWNSARSTLFGNVNKKLAKAKTALQEPRWKGYCQRELGLKRRRRNCSKRNANSSNRYNMQHRLDEIMRRYSEHLPGKDAAGRPTEPRERYRRMVEIKQKATRVMPECLCPVTCWRSWVWRAYSSRVKPSWQ